MNLRLVICGLAVWASSTIALRVAGHHLLHPSDWMATLILFAVSFPASAWIVRSLCSRFQLRREEWPAGAVAVLLPTVLFDSLSSAFFPVVFPNMAPEVAGVFGGWMLCCCAGGLVGVTIRRKRLL